LFTRNCNNSVTPRITWNFSEYPTTTIYSLNFFKDWGLRKIVRLSYNWRKPNVYGHRRIGHDIMPPTFYDRGGIKTVMSKIVWVCRFAGYADVPI
jgi:hypothetical protein